MDIVIVASDEERMSFLLRKIENTIEDAEIYTFTDPMLAVKYLYNYSADLVFADAKLKHLEGAAFIRLVKKRQPDLDIFVITEEPEDEEQFADIMRKHHALG